MLTAWAAVSGLLGFLVALIFIVVGLWKYRVGIDHNTSLANVQVILWSGVIIGSYLSMSLLNKGFLPQLNPNLIALMGISGGSLVTAAGIKAISEQKYETKGMPVNRYEVWKQDDDKLYYVGDPAKRAAGAKVSQSRATGYEGMLNSEKNPDQLSIAKLQMFVWTLVAIAIFSSIVAWNLLNNTPGLPDVGQELVALMGVSHGAYLGNKVADKPLGS